MPMFLITLIARSGVSGRVARALAWVAALAVVIALCWAAAAWFRGWLADGKEEAVMLDRQNISIEANERVANAIEKADANQMARDEADATNDKELRHEADTKSDASGVGPGVTSVLDRMRAQQAAGRRR